MEQVLTAFEREAARHLGPTLEWAATRVPYYAKAWGARWRRVRGPAELPRLPLLTKELALAHQRGLVARGTGPFAGVVSSGTQPRDGVLRVPRTEAEEEALAGWLSARRGGEEGGSLVLEVRAVHHGVDHLAPRPGWLRVPWSYSKNALRLVEAVLSRPQPDGRRVRRLLINAGALMPLTAHLLERGVSPRRFRVAGVSTTGFRLSPHWRARVEDAWGAPVFDNYSLSEVPGAALECRACGFNHWLPPPLWPEVVDARSRRPLARGTGVLVLTTLFPFVQAMPLIRYWTGDLVELGPPCRETGERGVRFRGRLGQSLLAPRAPPGEGVLVAAQDVVDALEAEALVARHPHPVEALGLVRSTDCGAVKFELSRGKGARLRVELKFDPRAYPLEAEALGRRVARRLIHASPALRALERTGRGELEVALVGPGALTRPWTKW